MSVNINHGSFVSDEVEVFYTKWEPQTTKAILQISHGMSEYIERYDEFARFMAENGFAVYGDDHRGHGKTGQKQGILGKIAEKDGYKLITDDLKRLTDLAKAEHPGVPVILFGHSMGSFLARNYAAHYSDAIDGLIIMGTSGKNPAAGLGIAAVNVISLFKGEDHKSAFINNLGFGSYNKAFPDNRTGFDWLSVNTDNVDRYIADDMCGFCFTLSGFRDLFNVLRTVSSDKWASGIRKDLPIFIVSGGDDPVGGFGKGIDEVRCMLADAGISSLEMKLYDGMRHEILNDNCKDEVYGDILRWCGKISLPQANAVSLAENRLQTV